MHNVVIFIHLLHFNLVVNTTVTQRQSHCIWSCRPETVIYPENNICCVYPLWAEEWWQDKKNWRKTIPFCEIARSTDKSNLWATGQENFQLANLCRERKLIAPIIGKELHLGNVLVRKESVPCNTSPTLLLSLKMGNTLSMKDPKKKCFDIIANGDIKKLEKIIRKHPDYCDLRSGSHGDGMSLLILASFLDHPEKVDLLLKKGAHPDQPCGVRMRRSVDFYLSSKIFFYAPSPKGAYSNFLTSIFCTVWCDSPSSFMPPWPYCCRAFPTKKRSIADNLWYGECDNYQFHAWYKCTWFNFG